MGDAGDYWREHREHKKRVAMEHRLHGDPIENPYQCAHCLKRFPTFARRQEHFESAHLKPKQ